MKKTNNTNTIHRILDFSETLKRKGLFLFGPRQSGKTTYLKTKYTDSVYVDLLLNENYAQYIREPGSFRKKIELLVHSSRDKQQIKKPKPKQEKIIQIIIVDEIQRVPELLNEIHYLIEEYKNLRFILTGSSSRKLKTVGTNLLGGRVSRQFFFPLCYPELSSNKIFNLKKILNYGTVPSIILSENPYNDLLDYVGLYLKEEIKFEGLVRDLNIFSEFLRLAALSNAEQINYSSFANDAQISGTTAKEYFQILDDTLIGKIVFPFMHTKKRKAVTSPKFYFFDCGIVNAIINRREVAEGTNEYGKQLEQFIFQELNAYVGIRKKYYKIEYWRSVAQDEVDFVLYETLEKIVGIEVKSTQHPRIKDFSGLIKLDEECHLKRKIVVCATKNSYFEKQSGVEVLTIEDFLQELWADKII